MYLYSAFHNAHRFKAVLQKAPFDSILEMYCLNESQCDALVPWINCIQGTKQTKQTNKPRRMAWTIWYCW